MPEVSLALTDMVIGREFLTWLWFRSDTAPMFGKTDGEAFRIEVERKIVVVGGEGVDTETATCSGENTNFAEARRGLKTGKQVEQAFVSFFRFSDSLTFQASLRADGLALRGIRLPAIDKDPDADPDALFLERMYLFEVLHGIFECLFAEFMTIRMNAAKWLDASRKVAEWITSSN